MYLFVRSIWIYFFFFFQAEDGIRDYKVTGVQTCALPIWPAASGKTTWWATYRSSQDPRTSREAATSLERAAGYAHTRCGVSMVTWGGRCSRFRSSRGNQAVATTSSC